MSKRIGYRSILGERGVTLTKQIILQMGYVFYETGGVEAGIDGIIEIRDPESEEATNRIIQVQVKATQGQFDSETEESFAYRVRESDLDYWLHGNAPVVLIVTRPDTEEAYWVSVKAYFSSPELIASRKVVFKKGSDRLKGSEERLAGLTLPSDSGVYMPPIRSQERIISNLLPVDGFHQVLYSAECKYRNGGYVWKKAKEMGIHLANEWICWDRRIWSFHDLAEEPWCAMFDESTIEEDDTDDWAYSDEQDDRNRFVWLLDLCVRELLNGSDVWYNKDLGLFYFKMNDKNRARQITYTTHTGRQSPITVFSAYPSFARKSYYRHSAMRGRYKYYEESWFYEVTPTYHFTWDGSNLDPYYEDHLSTIKRIEGNRAVLSQVEMWAHVLGSKTTLLSSYPFVSFGSLLEWTSQFGIDDDGWKQKKESASETDQMSLF